MPNAIHDSPVGIRISFFLLILMVSLFSTRYANYTIALPSPIQRIPPLTSPTSHVILYIYDMYIITTQAIITATIPTTTHTTEAAQ